MLGLKLIHISERGSRCSGVSLLHPDKTVVCNILHPISAIIGSNRLWVFILTNDGLDSVFELSLEKWSAQGNQLSAQSLKYVVNAGESYQPRPFFIEYEAIIWTVQHCFKDWAWFTDALCITQPLLCKKERNLVQSCYIFCWSFWYFLMIFFGASITSLCQVCNRYFSLKI